MKPTHRNKSLGKRHHAILKAKRLPCHLCGEPIDYESIYPHPDSFVVDHIIPLAQGGSDTLDNKAPSHSRCNSIKGDKLDAPIIKRSGSLD